MNSRRGLVILVKLGRNILWNSRSITRENHVSFSISNATGCLRGGLFQRATQGCLVNKKTLLSDRTINQTFRRGFRARSDNVETIPTNKNGPTRLRRPGGQNRNSGGSSHDKDARFFPFALKVGAYTIGFSAVVFAGSAVWQHENIKKNHEGFWKHGLEKRPARKRGEMRNTFSEVWNHLSMVHKVTYGIIGANLLVWIGWKIVHPQVMMKWFTLSITHSKEYMKTMFLSMFSHKSFIHFYLNMYVLSSFCSAWNQLSRSVFGDSNLNGHERYLAFYLTAGMASSFLSILIKTLGRIPQPSLGASGAIMGLIGYTCEKMPNNLLSIVFLPNFTFSANSAKNFIIGFDTIGLIIGAASAWRYMIFDHAGHLGGMLFGIWYANQGEKLFNKWCNYIMRLRSRK